MAYIERSNFSDLKTLVLSIIGFLKDNGFSQVSEANDPERFRYILQAEDAIDPFKSYTGAIPWRIAFEVAANKLHLYVSTERYLKNSGDIDVENYFYPNETPITDVSNNPGLIYSFVSREFLSVEVGDVYPMSYVVSITDHGLFLAVSDEANDEYQNNPPVQGSVLVSPRFSWVAVQRALKITGDVYVEGKAPLVCVYSKMENHPVGVNFEGVKDKISTNKSPLYQVPYYFMVSESDVNRPSRHYRADVSTDKSRPILNIESQVSFTEDDKVLISVPNGFNTSRYYYPLDLDMIATCSSDTLAKGDKVKLVKYNNVESEYLALSANRLFSTGMRLLVAIDTPVSTNNLPPRI